jgi:glucokinase
MLLCGDVGATNTTLALFARGRPLEPRDLAGWPSREAGGLEEIVATFLARAPATIEAACFGVAGPVVDGRAETTNLPWVVEAAGLGARLGAPVFLLNDLQALAHGIGLVPPSGLVVVNPGVDRPRGNAAVIAAGTGLGEAGLVWDGDRHLPFASEGGHADFAPRTERETALLHYLQRRFGHVSYERVVSGPGLVHVVEYLRDVEALAVPPALAAALATGEAPPAVTAAARAGTAPIAATALELFAAVYGAEAGNLALKLAATGGVYVGGGIAPKILPWLTDGRFREAFLAKGRFAGFLAEVPLRVVVAPNVALAGAARFAAERLERDR